MNMSEVEEAVGKAVSLMTSLWSELQARDKSVAEAELRHSEIDSIHEMKLKAEEEKLTAKFSQKEADFNNMILKHQHEFGKSSSQNNNSANSSSLIRLNVGGTVFTTTKSTLMSSPDSFFSSMVSSGVWEPDAKTGEFFIDRDPQFFKEILNYLRQGKLDGNLYGLLTVTASSSSPQINPSSGLSSAEQELLLEQIDFLQIDSLLGPPSPVVVGVVTWDFNANCQTHEQQEELMKQAAIKAGGTRAATLEEFQAGILPNPGPYLSVIKDGFVMFSGTTARCPNQKRLGCRATHNGPQWSQYWRTFPHSVKGL
eukprot:TRINITY_DN67533_c3_g4_i1.p1 TRINITY_DN67533_c3_g4~~TRINITY_DN67533_c3_g4_i1.p1  ORF type:complete len:312 (-),score=31.70 TRINITY_DN67533_c3_g4_i1:383-1318(-)